VRQDERAPFEAALHQARTSAYAAGEFVGQESFMRASEILALAEAAGIGPGVSVLDVCCGVAGPGRFITRELGCTYLGLDASAGAVAIARELASGLDTRFEVARVPPLPSGRFDVVLLLETMLAFPDKEGLLREVAGALSPGGRFAFTVEEGHPLREHERGQMPDADTVHLVELADLLRLLDRVGLQVVWSDEYSESHREVAESLIEAFGADAEGIAPTIGQQALDDLVASHRLWSQWLRTGRVRKLAFVAQQPVVPGGRAGPE
jgi:SAM-dependent methyltransferase